MNIWRFLVLLSNRCMNIWLKDKDKAIKYGETTNWNFWLTKSSWGSTMSSNIFSMIICFYSHYLLLKLFLLKLLKLNKRNSRKYLFFFCKNLWANQNVPKSRVINIVLLERFLVHENWIPPVPSTWPILLKSSISTKFQVILMKIGKNRRSMIDFHKKPQKFPSTFIEIPKIKFHQKRTHWLPPCSSVVNPPLCQ